MRKRIIKGALIEIAGLAILGIGVLAATSANVETTLMGIIGLSCLAAWSGLSVLSTLVSFDLIGS